MTFAEKNNFVVRHASEEYFEKDRDLFLKTFPGSPIIKELERAQPFSKKKLDERMLLELLDHYCADTVLEQRGIFKSHKKVITLTIEEAKKTLVESNIEDLTYEGLMMLATTLSIEPENKKKATLIDALKAYMAEPATGEGGEPGTGEGGEGGEGTEGGEAGTGEGGEGGEGTEGGEAGTGEGPEGGDTTEGADKVEPAEGADKVEPAEGAPTEPIKKKESPEQSIQK